MTNLLEINNFKDFIMYLNDMSGNERMKATVVCGVLVWWHGAVFTAERLEVR